MLVNKILIENTKMGECHYCGASLQKTGALTLRVETANHLIERDICPLCLIEMFDKVILGPSKPSEA